MGNSGETSAAVSGKEIAVAPDADALTTMRLPNKNVVMQLNPAETSLQYREIVLGRDYLKHGVCLQPGATVLDVGANIGIAALAFHWECTDVTVYAFEPTRPLFDALRWNYDAHGIRGKAFPFALSREPGNALVSLYPGTTAMSGLYADAIHDAAVTRTFLANSGFTPKDTEDMASGRHGYFQQHCELRTVSQIVDDENIQLIDLLKINVEKAESDVLAGIREDHWPLVQQIAMQVHDIDGRLTTTLNELERNGFQTTGAQDPLLTGTDIHDIFATRR